MLSRGLPLGEEFPIPIRTPAFSRQAFDYGSQHIYGFSLLLRSLSLNQGNLELNAELGVKRSWRRKCAYHDEGRNHFCLYPRIKTRPQRKALRPGAFSLLA